MTALKFEKDLKEYRRKNGWLNRRSGEIFEFEVLKYYRGISDFAIRSAGSHSIIDIVARRAGKLIYINCKKNGYREQHELRKLGKLRDKLVKNEVIILADKVCGRITYKKF